MIFDFVQVFMLHSLLRGKQDEKVSPSVTKGGHSPTGVANLATGGAPQGAVSSGGRGRSIGSGFFTPMRNRSVFRHPIGTPFHPVWPRSMGG